MKLFNSYIETKSSSTISDDEDETDQFINPPIKTVVKMIGNVVTKDLMVSGLMRWEMVIFLIEWMNDNFYVVLNKKRMDRFLLEYLSKTLSLNPFIFTIIFFFLVFRHWDW